MCTIPAQNSNINVCLKPFFSILLRHTWVKAVVLLLLLSTHSLDHCLWGEFDHPAFGPPARLSPHLACSSITPAGSVHKFSVESVVRMWVQLKRWYVCVAERHSGDGCDLASALCKYNLRKGYLC